MALKLNYKEDFFIIVITFYPPSCLGQKAAKKPLRFRYIIIKVIKHQEEKFIAIHDAI